MKFTVILAAVIAIAQAAPLINNGGKAIADSYIVVLKNGNTADSFKAKFDDIARRQNGRGRKPTIHRKYQKFNGFAATVNQAALKELLASDEVEFIEQDAVVTIAGSQSSPPSWGLPRVSQRTRNLAANYLFPDAAGEGVTAYVVDTGVYIEHNDLEGRATWGANFIDGSDDTDENGHGTHVAGTIGGASYGVAKKVSLVGVKVLDAEGSGSISGVVGGMDWVAEHATPGKSVVNMSLGGGKSATIDAAAQRLFDANIPLIVAAGNSATTNACNGSPSGAANTYTVAASDRNDRVASFTSYGSCVEIFAPGVGITSAWIGGADATNTISGTSMATPHVVGVAALYLSTGSYPTAQSLFDKLTSTATPNKITGSLKGSPNRLLFNGGGL
ncbi:MAG: subtilisin-like serine protease [Benniella sp.]|nr:MAG: subtilisin-like serine protease [Benniella sp.]